MKKVSKLICFLLVFVAVMSVFCTMSFATTGNYLIVDVFDHYDGNSSAILELELFDNHGNKINYSVLSNDQYCSVSYGGQYLNNPTYWSKEYLYDSKIVYGDDTSTIVN